MFFIFMRHTYVVLVRGTLIPLNKRCYICLHFCCKGKHLFIIFPKKSYILYIVFFNNNVVYSLFIYYDTKQNSKGIRCLPVDDILLLLVGWAIYISVASRWKVELL